MKILPRKTMKASTKRTLAAVLFAITIVGADITAGLVFDHSGLPILTDSDRETVDSLSPREITAVEARWEGGGSALMFVDDMSDEVRRHYAADPLHPVDYYSGAVPSDDAGAERWRHEPHLWGAAAADDPGRQTWYHEAPLWRFGDAEEDQPGYPADVLGELVTPVVDLRSVESPTRSVSPPLHSTLPSTPNECSDSGVSSLYHEPCQDLKENEARLQEAWEETESGSEEDVEARAALRVRHAYDFRADNVALTDGGRIEASYFHEGRGAWTEWEGVTPTHTRLRIGNDTVEGRGAAPDPAQARYGFNATSPEGTTQTWETDPGAPSPPEVPDPDDPPDAPDADAVEPPSVNGTGGGASVDGMGGNPFQANASIRVVNPQGDGPPIAFSSGVDPDATHTPPPHLYQGPIGSSAKQTGSSWDGFGGASMGWVESVVDLSAYAGNMVRLRFATATGESKEVPPPGEPAPTRIKGWQGWALDRLEVLAETEDGIDVLGLVEPGPDVLVSSGEEGDFTPVVAIHNRGRTPLDADVTVTVRGEGSETASRRISVGPLARGFFPLDDSFHDLLGGPPELGTHWLDVDATAVPAGSPIEETPGTPASLEDPQAQEAHASFYAHVTDFRDQEILQTEMRSLRTTIDGHEVEDASTFFNFDQHGILRATLRATGTLPVDLDLSDQDADLRPRLVDLAGQVVPSTFELMDTASVDDGTVYLPVSRAISGSLGAAEDTVTVAWRWLGRDIPQVLRVQLVDAESDILAEIVEINVRTVRPPQLAEDYDNDWTWMPRDGSEGCDRRNEWDGATGVVVCGASNGTMWSPVAALDRLDLRKGRDLQARLTYRGAADVTLQTSTSHQALTPLPPADVEWTNGSVAAMSPASAWTTQTVPLGTLPEDWSGWARMNITSGSGGLAVDVARMEILFENPQTQDLEAVPLMQQTFDATMRGWERVVSATGETGLAWLQAEDPIVGDLGIGKSSIRSMDTLLRLDSSIDLRDVARPRLEFRHWYDTGPAGVAVVEVARDPLRMPDTPEETPALPGPDRTPGLPDGTPEEVRDATPEEVENGTELPTGPHPLPSTDVFEQAPNAMHGAPPLGEGEWRAITTFQGTSPGLQTAPVTIALDPFVGEVIHLRFRYHVDASTSQFPPPQIGWILESLRVTGQGLSSPISVADAGRGFSNTTADGPVRFTSEADVADRPTQWEREPRWWRHNDAVLPYPGHALVSDPVRIDSMFEPVLRIDHEGTFKVKMSYGSGSCTPGTGEIAAVDLDYQALQEDGTWPSTWNRVHGDAANPLLLDPDGNPVGRPFNTTVPATCPPHPGGPNNPSVPTPYARRVTEFDLGKIQNEGTVRFRLPTFFQGTGAAAVGSDWIIHGVEVAEQRHLVDARVDAIQPTLDDLDRLTARAPDVVEGLELQGETVLANDEAFVAVNVTNEGITPLRLEVSLAGERLADDAPLDVRFVRVEGNSFFPDPVLSTGNIELPPGTKDQVLFQVDLSRAPPGEYRLTARADSIAGADTDFTDNTLQIPLRVLPLRDVAVDAAASVVEPFAGGPDTERRVRVRISNEGNVEESRIVADAELVRMTGLNSFLPMGVDLGTREVSLTPRGDGVATPSWGFGPDDIPAGVEFVPGAKYAVKVDVEAAHDSVPKWWGSGPLPIADDGTGLVDATQPPNDVCGCLLVPFVVERVLYHTDFSAQNSTTEVPKAFDVSTDEAILGGWNVTTLVEGEVVDPEQAGLEAWRAVGSQALGGAGEDATGKTWLLPEYEGRQQIEHRLESPTLPSHIVRGDSRDILAMRHLSELDEGQAVVETRRLFGGEWTDWVPVDSLRSQRIAVVLAPDFPHVISSAINSTAQMYTNNQTGHPVPPFYENPGGKPYITNPAGCAGPLQGDSCQWSPFPSFPQEADAANQAWVRVLNQTLRALAEDLTHDGTLTDQGISLFTTLETEDGTPNQDLAIGSVDPATGTRFHSVASTAGDVTYRFPIKPLEKLGLRLDSYGAILLFGDNATTTFANRSATLERIAHGPADAAEMPPDPIAQEHHRKLFAILQAAPGAGVGLVGTMGPAAATLALSGAARDVELSVWQTNDHMPAPSYWAHPDGNQLKCTLQNGQVPSDPAASQPLPPQGQGCTVQAGQFVVPDPNSVFTYFYLGPRDAQSLGLTELIAAGGADHTTRADFYAIFGQPPVTVGNCNPGAHPIFPSNNIHCIIHNPFSVDQKDGTTFVSAARPANTQAWTQQLITTLRAVDGALPAGDGAWRDLPTRLSFPIGGRFTQLADGTDYFDGAPIQVRIRVTSDPVAGGHGRMAIDSLTLLGTNRTQDLGIRFVDPVHGRSYAPGSPFQVSLEVTNRGVEDTPKTWATIDAEQWFRGVPNECNLPVPSGGTRVNITALNAGKQTLLPVKPPQYAPFNGGFFPRDPACRDSQGNEIPLTQQASALNFTANLAYAPENRMDPASVPVDDDPFDDAVSVTTRGRATYDQFGLHGFRAVPNEAHRDDVDTILLRGQLQNHNTQSQQISVTLTVEDARPLPCIQQQQRGLDTAACHIHGDLAEPVVDTQVRRFLLPRDADRDVPIMELDLDELGMDPGVYLVTAVTSTSFIGQGGDIVTLTNPAVQARIHLAGDDVPDGAWAFEGHDLSGLASLNGVLPGQATSAPSGNWDPSGFFTTGVGATDNHPPHNGLYGPDPRTHDDGSDLRHGWRVLSCTQACPPDATRDVVEWRRDAAASYGPGDPTTLRSAGTPPTPGNQGLEDFGPDRLVWYPHDGQDQRFNPERWEQYLTLASFDDPALSLLSRWEATDLTGLVVEMQLPGRNPCQPPASTQRGCVQNAWNWNTPWFQLSPLGHNTTPPTGIRVSADGGSTNCGSSATPSHQNCRTRSAPSNPLAGQHGLWGGHSGRHAESDGWERLTYPIFSQSGIQTYCQQQVAGGFGGERTHPLRDVCRYAHTEETGSDSDVDHFISRPVRFRFSAASFGGDVGTNFWQIADVSLTEHRPAFLGPDSIPLQMQDNSVEVVPLRVQNLGSVDDIIHVSWRPPRDQAILQQTQVRLDTHSDLSHPRDSIDIPLAPGESRAVWVQVETGFINHLPPGSRVGVPFVVEAASLRDQLTTAEVLVDARFTTRTWPDLVPRLVLDGDDAGGPVEVSEGVPVTPVALVSNTGRTPIGGPESPVHVRLVEVGIDSTSGTELSRRELSSHLIHQEIRPLHQGGKTVPVELDAWVPPETGVYRILAEVNLPNPAEDGILPLVESSRSNNIADRTALVGPIKFPDLQITDAWLSPVEDDGCRSEVRVQRPIAGRAYCVAATVANHGLEGALAPRVEFALGASSPFSVNTMKDRFPDRVFPGGEEPQPVTVTSRSPWVAKLRSDGGDEWTFFINVFSDGVMPNFENKEQRLTVQVDRFALVPDSVPTEVDLAAGAETHLRFYVTNKGNAPLTPRVQVDGDSRLLHFHAEVPPQLLPGERGEVLLRIVSSSSLHEGTDLPSITLSAQEDPSLDVPLPTRLRVLSEARPTATALPLQSMPNGTAAEVVLDNSQSPHVAGWTVAAVDGPATASEWQGSTGPFERIIDQVPLRIDASTPPGRHDVQLRLLATSGQVTHPMETNLLLEVLRMPSLDAALAQRSVTTQEGGGGVLNLILNNTGNVPLGFQVNGSADHGRFHAATPQGRLDPGQTLPVRLTVDTAGATRTVGTISVHWHPLDAPSESGVEELHWQVEAPVVRLHISDTDIGTLRPARDTPATLHATLENRGNAPTRAEALVVIDGRVHGGVEVDIGPGEARDVSLPFRLIEDRNHSVSLVARPAGTGLGPDHPDFYEAGDARARDVRPEGEPSHGIAAPAGVLALVAAGFLVALRRRGRST